VARSQETNFALAPTTRDRDGPAAILRCDSRYLFDQAASGLLAAIKWLQNGVRIDRDLHELALTGKRSKPYNWPNRFKEQPADRRPGSRLWTLLRADRPIRKEVHQELG